MSRSIPWDRVETEHVLSAIHEYDDVGATEFFRRHGYGPTTTYDLHVEGRQYPPKAILGTAYRLATGQALAPSDFEGGRSGAVRVLSSLGFDVRPRHERVPGDEDVTRTERT